MRGPVLLRKFCLDERSCIGQKFCLMRSPVLLRKFCLDEKSCIVKKVLS